MTKKSKEYRPTFSTKGPIVKVIGILVMAALVAGVFAAFVGTAGV